MTTYIFYDIRVVKHVNLNIGFSRRLSSVQNEIVSYSMAFSLCITLCLFKAVSCKILIFTKIKKLLQSSRKMYYFVYFVAYTIHYEKYLQLNSVGRAQDLLSP